MDLTVGYPQDCLPKKDSAHTSDDDIPTSGRGEMKTFFEPETPVGSSFLFPSDDGSVHADHNRARDMLLSTTEGACDTKTMRMPRSVDLKESNSTVQVGTVCCSRESKHASSSVGVGTSSTTIIATRTGFKRSNSIASFANRLSNTQRLDPTRSREQTPHLFKRQHRYHNSLRQLDHCILDHGLAVVKTQLRDTDQHSMPVESKPKSLRSSIDGRTSSSDCFPSSVAMTKDEFDSLPHTIQRKYFSTLERLRIVRRPDLLEPHAHGLVRERSDSPAASSADEQDNQPSPLKLGFGHDELQNAPHRRSQVQHHPLRIYANPEDRLRKRRHFSCDNLSASRSRQSVILDATEESILRMGKRQTQLSGLEGPSVSVTSAASLKPKNSEPAPSDKMLSVTPDGPPVIGSSLKATADSIYESFRFLEEDNGPDLRLYLDGHFDSRAKDVPTPPKRQPSFRRHLSLSKLPFAGRPSMTLNRPVTKDVSTAASSIGALDTASRPPSGSSGHARRRSRAVSVISPSKHLENDATEIVDHSASHYRDPDARMKLRVYLASPHKFDEAIEFGFPSIEEVQSKEDSVHKRAPSRQERPVSRLHKTDTFLEDDRSSLCSDDTSVTEPESPKTPETLEKPVPVKPTRMNADRESRIDYAHAPASSREMTLRMTLTRPDLRANEEQIYGWQKDSVGRKSHTREDSISPLSPSSGSFSREGHAKESIERQFAMMDQEDLLASENGVMRRFWNRMRRS